jgi:hypothetical protein
MSNTSCPDFNNLQSCPINPSYLRPENGATIIPWLYSAILLALHLPLAFLRVVKWKQSQWFSLAMAVFTISLTCLSYFSTKLNAQFVYVWFPIALTADISGAMQLIILIEKDDGYRHYRGRKFASAKHGMSRLFGGARVEAQRSTQRRGPAYNVDIDLQERLIDPQQRLSGQTGEGESRSYPASYQGRDSRNVSYTSLPSIPIDRDPFWTQGREQTNQRQSGIEPVPLYPAEGDGNTVYQRTSAANRDYPADYQTAPDPLPAPRSPGHIMPLSLLITFILSIIFLLILFSLQIVGLVYAAMRYFNHETLIASWCSPAFDIGGVAFLPSSSSGSMCQSYPITPTHGGTGCIGLPGDQETWLMWTFIALCVEVILQVADGFLMITSRKWDRPWLTMTTGVIVYISLVTAGVLRTLYLPISGHTVAIVNPQGTCKTDLFEGGLRGAIVAWSDGVFQGLGTAYFGPAGD